MKQILLTIIVAGSVLLSTNQTQAQCYSAVELDGVDDYMHTPLSAAYTYNNFTIEAWINSPDYTPNEMYVTIAQNSFFGLGGWPADGTLSAFGGGLTPTQITSTGAGTTPTVNAWHHIAYVYNGVNQIVYVDGVEIYTVVSSGSVNPAAGFNYGITIGARFTVDQQFTNSIFEDVRVWEVARTPAQLNANMSINLTGTEPGLVAYYRFEDGAGSTTVTDLSGNGNTLTLYNMDPSTDWVSGLFSTDAETTDVIVNCGPLTWIDGNEYLADNNTATFTYVGGAAGGCDSIVTLNLTVNAPADTSVTTVSPLITSNEVGTGAQFQWIYCDSNNVFIPGESGSSYTATATGDYAVIVTTLDGCRDTSACIPISFAALDQSRLETGITVSPNPTNGAFSISSLNYSGEVRIEVLDVTGKLIYNSTENLAPHASTSIDLSEAANGVYIVNVSDMNEAHSIRVVKK